MVAKNNRIHGNNTISQIFTPDYVAEFMVKNVIKIIKDNKKNTQDLKTLEPAVGEGIFLKYLLQNKFSNIFAYEMDLSLKEFLLDSFPTVNFRFDNFFGSEKHEKFDLIIGNPPYLGQNYNADIFQDYIIKYPTCAKYFVGNMDLFYYFIHLGIEKLIPGGIISYITTNYWITKSQKTGIKLLKPHILNECYLLQYIDLSCLNVFEGAKGQHNCIFVLQKKTEEEKLKKKNKDIQIIQVVGANKSNKSGELVNKRIFEDLIQHNTSQSIRKYNSALTNNDLNQDENWNIIYLKEVKIVVDKIENYCKYNEKITRIKDFFIIRNGLILINDNIFILKIGKELKIEKNEFFLKVNGNFTKLSETEQSRLKKVYKSKSITLYGYNCEDNEGYILYFNKNEFKNQSPSKRNKSLEQKYPTLAKYLRQYEMKLREILINAKENPEDLFYPRRGSFIRRLEEGGKEKLVDLEPFYDNSPKIFFKYISSKNIFGYSTDPYYATSDTYFLWPLANKEIDYLFVIAYLNSKLVSFLYKAKNISIKRSKTKLEYNLPLPDSNNFRTEEKCIFVELIKKFTLHFINGTNNNHITNLKTEICRIFELYCFDSSKYNQLKQNIIRALETYNVNVIQTIIDDLFFKLFDLDECKINKLLSEYY